MDSNTSWFWDCACKALREANAPETPSWRLRHNQGDITGVNQLTWLWELTTDTTQWHWHGYGVINQLGIHSWLSWFMLVYHSITMEKYHVPNLQIVLQLWRHAVLLRFLPKWGPSFLVNCVMIMTDVWKWCNDDVLPQLSTAPPTSIIQEQWIKIIKICFPLGLKHRLPNKTRTQVQFHL